MATRMRLSPRHGIAIYTVPNSDAARADDGPLLDPYTHISRLLFHSRLSYLSLPAMVVSSVILPVRTGSGQVTYRPAGWPAKHGAGSKAIGVLLVGEKSTQMTQMVLGETHPRGLYGRSGWRRLYLTIASRGCQLTEVWNSGGAPIKQTRLFVGYAMTEVTAGYAPGNARTPCRIAPAAGILRIGAFDASKPWLRTTRNAARAFTLVKGINAAASSGGAAKIVRANGTELILPGIGPYSGPQPKPKRYAVAPR